MIMIKSEWILNHTPILISFFSLLSYRGSIILLLPPPPSQGRDKKEKRRGKKGGKEQNDKEKGEKGRKKIFLKTLKKYIAKKNSI